MLSALLVISACGVAHAQATYTWTQMASGTTSQAWGTTGNWAGSSVFVSGSSNQLVFFADTTTVLPVGTQTVTGIPATL